jgi:hypothetical protein
MTVEINLKKAEMVSNIAAQTSFVDQQKLQYELGNMFGQGEIPAYLEGLGLLAAFLGAGALPLVAISLEEESGFDKKT